MNSLAIDASVIAILGPTASGKSALAMALAQRLPVEIVSVDSAQVYRGMDIGTAKPGAQERAAVPHHLLDLLDPGDVYSAARFRDDALAAVADILSRGRLPVLVGGTMLYFKALREGLSSLPPSSAETRAELGVQARARGWPAMHAELAEIDPETAARLQPNDSHRIERALEIFRLTGAPMSRQLGRRGEPPPWNLVQIALVPGDRAALHRRIAQRFDAMLAAGLVNEVIELRRRHALSAALPSMHCVGYRQVWQMLEGELAAAELRERGIFATRQLAKRQLTWLRGWSDITVIDCLGHDLAASALEAIKTRGIHG